MIWIMIAFVAAVVAYVVFGKKQNESYLSSFLGLVELMVEFGVFKISGVLLLAAAIFGIANATEIAGGISFIWFVTTVIGIIGIILVHTGVVDKVRRRNSVSQSASSPKALRQLPIPSDAHDVLECFCKFMNVLDSAMTYCSYEGEAMLLGGVNDSGNGYAYLSYTKDWPLQKVFEGLGFDVPISQNLSAPGWSIGGHDDDWVYLHADGITGYREWAGYDSLKQIGCDDSAIEKSWESAIRATINNEWSRATITSCVVRINQGTPGTFSYDVRIKT